MLDISKISRKPIVKVYVAMAVESAPKGKSWWVTLENSIGQKLTPEMHYIRDRSITSAYDWAGFLGIEMTPYHDPDTGEIVLPEMALESYDDPEDGRN